MSEAASVAGDRQLVRIWSTDARVRVVAEHRANVGVDGTAEVQTDGGQTTISSQDDRLVVRVPLGTNLVIGTTSARIEVEGAVGTTAIVTESGRIEVENATSVDARTTSARVTVGTSDGLCRVRTISGSVTVDSCGGADVATDSGRVALKGVHGPVHAHCVSGSITIELETGDDVDAETVSGRIVVSLPEGVEPLRTTSPNPSPDERGAADCVVCARSVSGRVHVKSR